MRAEVVAWAAFTAALWAVVAAGDGHVQAAAFMLALLGTAVSVGLSILMAIDFAQSTSARAWRQRVLHPGQGPLCSSCSRAMASVGDLMMCASCDGAVVGLSS